MSGYYQRNRDRPRGQQYRVQNRQTSGGGNYNRDSPYQRQSNMARQQMVNPWQSGMMPAGGGGLHTGSSDEAALAFNILNQVLATDTPSMMSPGQSQGGGFQDRKSRNMGMGNRLEDRRRTQSPQFSNRNQADRGGSRQWSNRSRSPHRSNSARRDLDHNRKPLMDRLGKQSDRTPNRRYPEFRRNQNQDQSKGDKRKKSTDENRYKSRERQISVDRKSENTETKEADSDGKNQDKNAKSEKVAEKKKVKDKEPDEYVIKSLKCHICEIDTFESIESFRNHKRSEEHKSMANLYNSRSEAVLQLMRADAKLAANRDREKAGNANKETFYARCIKCDCAVADAFKSHKKSIEHELVDNYLTRECCNSSFARRKEFEDHRLTIPHLKRQMESSKDIEPPKTVVLAFGDEEEAATTVLRDLKEEHRLELESPADFPDYNTDKPIGLSHVHKKRRFNCTVCKKAFPSYNTMALAHCRSFNHYLMLSSYLEKQLKEVEDDEITETETDEQKEDEEGGEKKKEEEEEDGDGDGPVADSGSTEVKDEEEEETKDENEDEMDNDNENTDDEDLGEILPPLEDGGIILEDIDKPAEDEELDEEEEDTENEVSRDGDDYMSSGDQDKDEGNPDESDTEDKVMEEMETEEKEKNEEMPDDANDVEDEVVEEEVKPKAKQERKGKGKARGRGLKR